MTVFFFAFQSFIFNMKYFFWKKNHYEKMEKIFGICFYNVGDPVCAIKAKYKGLLI